MDVRAISRYERTAPNKLRQVTGQIVGLPVGQARQLLQV
ncbi:MAG: 50S ribosomal protein L22, partial [Actinobacteria bacterium QS_5_72_10]